MTDRAPTPWENGTGDYLAGVIVDGLLADVRKVRIMFPQVVANAAAGNGGKTGKEGCDGLLVGMEFVMPFFVLEDFLQA